MNNEKDKVPENDTSSNAALERGKKAIEADEKINKKDVDKPQVKIDKKKDQEQWRNEG